MSRFTNAYQRWLQEPIPPGSGVDTIDELHAELAQWDAFVADLAVPYSKGAEVAQPVYDFGEAIAQLGNRLRQSERLRPADASTLDRYVNYLHLVAEVFAALSKEVGWSWVTMTGDGSG